MKIHLITNCTSRKSSKLKHDVKIKDICGGSDFPSKQWQQKLQIQNDLVPAINVYVGDHWSKVIDIYNLNYPVWVVSAGYGLISAKQEVCSYNATFNANDENSVSRLYRDESLAKNNIRWWNEINFKETTQENDIGPIQELYRKNLADVFFIVVPPNYLKVLEPEILKLTTSGIINTANTFIFSSNQKLASPLKSLFYQAKDDFCKSLGGSRISLNIRLANQIIKNISLERAVTPQVKEMYNALVKNSSPAERFNRKKMTDGDVNSFIENELKNVNRRETSASKLLRNLRDKGMACEQKRFSKLYKAFIEKPLEQELIGNI